MDLPEPHLPGATPTRAAPEVAPPAAPEVASLAAPPPAPPVAAMPAPVVSVPAEHQPFAPPASTPPPPPAAARVAPATPSLASPMAAPQPAPAPPPAPSFAAPSAHAPAMTPHAMAPAPVVPAPAAPHDVAGPDAAVSAAPQLPGQSAPIAPAPHAGTPTTPSITATPTPTVAATSSGPRRGLLMAGLGAVTVGAVAAGAFVITRDSGTDVVVDDDATEIVRDSNIDTPQDTASYNFAAAAAAAQQAASITFDMDIQTPDGPMVAVASLDRASGRMAFDIDISQFVIEDDFFDMGDSFQLVIDEQNNITYMSASVMGGFFGEIDAAWISTNSGDFSSDDDLFGQLFNNPLGIADVFGDTEPIDLGEETIDGETLRHYEVMFADDATDDTVYDVWISEDSQIRRMMFDIEEDGEVGTMDLWIAISADPVDIPLPDPSDVIDLDEMFDMTFSETTEIDGGEATVTVESDDDSTSISVSVDGDPIEFSTDDLMDDATESVVED